MPERVHTVDDYYDGPLTGIADFDGKPHRYTREFDEAADAHTDIFRLVAVSEPIFKLSIEKAHIFDRWREAYQGGTTSIEAHPALPLERARYSELQKAIDTYFANAEADIFRAKGRFILVRPDQRDSPQGFEVEWLRLER